MSEIRLTTTGGSAPIAPTSGVPPTAPIQTAPVAPPPPPHDAPAVSLAGSLASLGAGDRLEGVVIGQDASGAPILRTASGSFLLITEQPIPDNTHVVLQILSMGNPIQALILTQDGVPLVPPPEAELSLIRPEVAATVATLSLLDTTDSPLRQHSSSRLHAIVLPDPLAALPGGTRPLPPGSALVLQLARTGSHVSPNPVLPSSTGSSSENDAPSPASPKIQADHRHDSLGGNPAGPFVLPDNPAKLNSLAGEATKSPGILARTATAVFGETAHRGFTVRTGLQAPSPSSARGTGSALLGSRIIGVVAAEPTAGQVLVRASVGLLSIATPLQLNVGETLTFDLVSIAPPVKSSASTAEAFGDPLSRLSHEWPALRDALPAWQAVDPAAARLMADSVLPRSTEHLASGLLFLFTALRTGDAGAWLGKSALQKLEQNGYRDLARRLSEDFADLSRLGQQVGNGDWRAVPLPIYDGQTLVQIMLFARHKQNQGEDGAQDHGTRFILEAELSVTGPVQLDGLVQLNHFDLIVRTHTPLPAEIRHGVGDVFQAGLKDTHSRGTIAFQVSQHFQPVPLGALRGGQTHTALVV